MRSVAVLIACASFVGCVDLSPSHRLTTCPGGTCEEGDAAATEETVGGAGGQKGASERKDSGSSMGGAADSAGMAAGNDGGRLIDSAAAQNTDAGSLPGIGDAAIKPDAASPSDVFVRVDTALAADTPTRIDTAPPDAAIARPADTAVLPPPDAALPDAAAAPAIPDTSPAVTQTIFTTQTPDSVSHPEPEALELGIRFSANVRGEVVAIRYWRVTGDDAQHIGHLWAADGTLLGSVTFANESATGWQEAFFDKPVAIVADAIYVSSVNSGSFIAADFKVLLPPVMNGALRTVDEVGVYSAAGVFPMGMNLVVYPNYFRDVLFIAR